MRGITQEEPKGRQLVEPTADGVSARHQSTDRVKCGWVDSDERVWMKVSLQETRANISGLLDED